MSQNVQQSNESEPEPTDAEIEPNINQKIAALDHALKERTRTIEELTVALGETKAKLEAEKKAKLEAERKAKKKGKAKTAEAQTSLFMDNVEIGLRFQQLQLAQIRLTIQQKDDLIAQQAAVIEKLKE